MTTRTESGAEAREIWLPATFWNDHADRELPSGELVREAGSRVLVRCTQDELAEIRSDAAYYSDKSGGPDWPEGGPIRRSAAATVRAIDRAAPAAWQCVRVVNGKLCKRMREHGRATCWQHSSESSPDTGDKA